MKQKSSQLILICLTCLAVQACLGAQRLDAKQLLQQAMMRKQRDLTSDTDAEYFEAASRFRRDDVKIPLTEINEVMSLDDDTTLDVRKTFTTVQGTQLIKMQELYKGRPVSDGVVTLETDEEGHHVIDASGNVYRHINVSFDDKNELDADDALDVCLKHNHDLHHRDNINNIKVEQEVFFDEDVKAYPAYLVQYLVESEAALKRPTCIVNVRDARVTMSWDALETCMNCGLLGAGGNEKIGKIRYGKMRCLNLRKENDVCYLENKYVKVINNNFTVDERNKTEVASYNCKEIDDAVNGAYSPLLDALFYGTVVGKMFEDWYNMSPLTDRVIFRVHYGINVSQASWDGRQVRIGDGGAKYHPFVALDIVAHEVGHGVTERYSGLFYYGQWGGIKEAFSDMMGETTEAYLDEADWIFGADVIKGENSPLRYLNYPEKDNRSISHASKYYPLINVHRSSGVYNKAFYLLVHEYNQPIQKVFHVFLLANMMYWHHMSDFEMAACDVMKAAYDLGQNLFKYRKAFSEIGLKVCDIRHHVVRLRKAKKYSNITVGRGIYPSFFFAVPGVFAKKVIVTANSSYGEVGVILSIQSRLIAVGIPSASYDMNPENHYTYFNITLGTLSTQTITNVTLEATYSCWTGHLKNKVEQMAVQKGLDHICDTACEDYKTGTSMA